MPRTDSISAKLGLAGTVLGFLCSAFFAGVAYGGDKGDVAAVARRLSTLEDAMKSAREDHDTILRIDERVTYLVNEMHALRGAPAERIDPAMK